ncbi:hypothetical protein [Tepidimonas charontis]|uniref:Uncharacterized protein n=1 Tax=Tepidimonas charontis TaxID=2267262 RepID=A0A554X256_9BURK|nr:hypothetical protein [Tepidimonas charontis]TSE29875.1 hypothetical protein Tchar_02524 [Tepidimonas charontis]
MLGLTEAGVERALARTLAYRKLAMVDFAKAILPNEDKIRFDEKDGND